MVGDDQCGSFIYTIMRHFVYNLPGMVVSGATEALSTGMRSGDTTKVGEK